jgi:hypothetical protein
MTARLLMQMKKDLAALYREELNELDFLEKYQKTAKALVKGAPEFRREKRWG